MAIGAEPQVQAALHAEPGTKAGARPALLAVVVAASGFAGLGYELVWTRLIAVALGTDFLAVLGVVTGFFAGLAAGALVLDGVIRRARAAWRAYAALELCIAAWAVASVWLLPLLARVLPALLGPAPGPALHFAAAFALPALLLLPATAAMGGTLIALERLVAGRYGPRVTAGVYGANTAGAMAGALGCVFVLMPGLGLRGTLLAMAAVNLFCAGGAWRLRDGAAPAAATGGAVSAPTRLYASLFATGLLGVGLEIAIVRAAAQMLQDTVQSFAALLAMYLLGTAAGGLLWQRARVPAGVGLLAAVTALTGVGTAALLPPVARAVQGEMHAGVWGELAVAGLLFLLPAAAMGALFGELAQGVRNRRGTLGVAVGINACGAALAPMVVALGLIPALGAVRTTAVLAVGFVALVPARAWGRARATAPALLAAAGAAALLLGDAPSLVRVPAGGSLLASVEGPMAAASVVEDGSGTRYLEVNGHFRMGGTRSVRSDWRQAALPLLLHAAPEGAPLRALFLGVGTGATLWGAAHVPGVTAEGVELLPEVLALLPWSAEPPNPDQGPDAPVPALTLADARRFVAADRRAFDVIVADLFHPALDGTSALYTTEHFQAVRARLAPGGVFCQWLPLYQLGEPSLRAIIRSFLDVYPGGTAWLAHYSVETPMLALIGPREIMARLPAGDLGARLADPAAAEMMRRTGLRAPADVLGLFVADAAALRAYAGDGPRNTDNDPFVAFDAARNVRALAAPHARTLLAMLRAMPPGAEPDVAGTAYRHARDAFLEAGAALPPGLSGRALIDAATPGLLEAVRLSADFDPAYNPLLDMARTLRASDPEAARSLLRAITAAAPNRPEARALLDGDG